jgi:hypothetical protein
VSGMVDPSGVTNGEILHDARKRNVSYLDCQVNMVVHTAEGMEPAVKAFNGRLHDQINRDRSGPEENRQPGVAPNRKPGPETRKPGLETGTDLFVSNEVADTCDSVVPRSS